MNIFSDSAEKIAEIYERFNEVKVRMDYVEGGTKQNLEEFKEVLQEFDRRLKEVEKTIILNQAKIQADMQSMKTMFEAVYKQSIKEVIDAEVRNRLRNKDQREGTD